MRLVVTATIDGIGPILCGRPYPRPDHCDPFGYAESERDIAERRADELRAQFPANSYQVQESD